MLPIIDAHAMLGRESYLALDADELLCRMDAAGIATAIARPMGAGLVADTPPGTASSMSAGSTSDCRRRRR